MWVLKLKLNFKPKMFVALLAVCSIIAGIVAWLTGLSFWILVTILIVAVLVNGLIATWEDEDM